MEYIINLASTITSYIYSFFTPQDSSFPLKHIEMVFIDDDEVNELIDSIKKEIEDEKDMKALEFRYMNFVKDYDKMIIQKISEKEKEEENHCDDDDDDNDDDNNEGKILVPA